MANQLLIQSHRRVLSQAIDDALNPSGMSTHDGKARVPVWLLQRMLAIIDQQTTDEPTAMRCAKCGGKGWYMGINEVEDCPHCTTEETSGE